MATSVIHQPRVAWDGARAFVAAACGPDYDAFAGRVDGRLGDDIHDELTRTHDRILTDWQRSGGDRRVTDLELGRWRVRLDELLRTHPELTETLRELIVTTR